MFTGHCPVWTPIYGRYIAFYSSTKSVQSLYTNFEISVNSSFRRSVLDRFTLCKFIFWWCTTKLAPLTNLISLMTWVWSLDPPLCLIGTPVFACHDAKLASGLLTTCLQTGKVTFDVVLQYPQSSSGHLPFRYKYCLNGRTPVTVQIVCRILHSLKSVLNTGRKHRLDRFAYIWCLSGLAVQIPPNGYEPEATT